MPYFFKNNDSGNDKKHGIVFASIGFVATNPLVSRKEVKKLPRKRQHRYAFYLDDMENEMLLSQTKEYNISVSKFIRMLILYQCIKFPPKEIRSVVPELRRIGNNLNQIALHKNTDNLHCHIVVNSVSFVDGKKFNDNKAFLNKMRNVSDTLCKEQGLSVIENPKQSKHQCYPQYIAERDGDYNKFTTLKKDIDECILRTGGEKGFIYEMQKLGCKFDFTKPHVTVNHPSYKRPVWLCDLGDEYHSGGCCQSKGGLF